MARQATLPLAIPDRAHPTRRRPVLMGTMSVMASDQPAEVTALAINVTIPEALRWTDTRRGVMFRLTTTLNLRLLADGRLAARASGRPADGGRGTYVSFAVPDDPCWPLSSPRPPPGLAPQWTAHRGLR